MKVAVVGGGIAGTAAAWAARRSGLDVTAFLGRAGASSLYAGALDVLPWDDRAVDEPLESDLQAFAVAVDAWSVGTRSARVATFDGVLRPARGRDSSLLDLAPLAGRRVAVAATRVDGWDAAALARSLSSSPWAARTATRFEAATVEGLVEGAEGRAAAYDIAALHDAPERLRRLAGSVRRAPGAPEAWLFGPWLGTAPGVAEALAGLVGKPCGETTSAPGGPAGARFDTSRDALFASNGVVVRREIVKTVERRDGRFFLEPDAGEAASFDAVVLAIGGVLSGGIVFGEGSETGPQAFHASVRFPLELGFDGRVFDRASSGGGVDLAALGLGVLERVGILAQDSRARGMTGVFVAGDCVADLPRTALAAANSGIAAARRMTTLLGEGAGRPVTP